jgi:hypothetical protein
VICSVSGISASLELCQVALLTCTISLAIFAFCHFAFSRFAPLPRDRDAIRHFVYLGFTLNTIFPHTYISINFTLFDIFTGYKHAKH